MTISNNGPKDASLYMPDLDDLQSQLDTLSGVNNDIDAALVNDLIKDIQKVAKAADKDRVALKKPFADAAKKVQDEFNVVRDAAAALIKSAKAVLEPYLIAERRKADEARRIAEEEAAKRQRIADALKDNIVVGDAVKEDAEHAERIAAAAIKQVKEAGQSGSFSGNRSAALRKTYTASITDPAAAAVHFSNNPRVQEAIEAAANALLRSPATRVDAIPGMKITINEIVA